MIAAAYAAAPLAAALLAYLLWRRGLSPRLFLDALAIGATLGAAIGFAEAPFDLKINTLKFSPLTISLFFAGLPEEGAKMLGAAAFLRGHWRARSRGDVVLAAGALSLGFALLEDIIYLAAAKTGWAPLAVERSLTAVPFHVFEGIAGGFVVASVAPTLGGVLLALAAWVGLAVIHAAYDFSVFASAPGAVLPGFVSATIAALGWERGVALRVLLLISEVAAAALAGAALAALPPVKATTLTTGRLVRWAQGRATRSALGLPLAAGGVFALAAGIFAATAMRSAETFVVAATFAVLPLALGLMLLAGPRQQLLPASRPVRLFFAGFMAAALALAGWAAFAFGPTQWRAMSAAGEEARGARAMQRNDFDEAVDDFSRAHRIAPDRIEPLSQRAAANAARDRFDLALADVDAALQLSRTTNALYVQRSEIDRQRNDPRAAVADLQKALAQKPDDPALLAMRGQARLEALDRQGAYEDLAAASHIAPDNPFVRRSFAAWDVDAGDYDAALRDLNARLHDDPKDYAAAFQRGRVWLYKGEPARALPDLNLADHEEMYLYPALWAYLARVGGHRPGSAPLAVRLAEAPNKWPAPVARMLIGEIDFDAARAAASSDDERCEVDFYYGAMRIATGSFSDAAPALRKAAEECPATFIEYEGARAELRKAE